MLLHCIAWLFQFGYFRVFTRFSGWVFLLCSVLFWQHPMCPSAQNVFYPLWQSTSVEESWPDFAINTNLALIWEVLIPSGESLLWPVSYFWLNWVDFIPPTYLRFYNMQATCDSSFFKQPATKIDLFLSSARGNTESTHMSKKIPFESNIKKKLTQEFRKMNFQVKLQITIIHRFRCKEKKCFWFLLGSVLSEGWYDPPSEKIYLWMRIWWIIE